MLLCLKFSNFSYLCFFRRWVGPRRIFFGKRRTRSRTWALYSVQYVVERKACDSWWVWPNKFFLPKLMFLFDILSADNVRFIVMNENKSRVLWRCSLMSTKTRKCPARILMYKGNPPRFVMRQCVHQHMELIRGKSVDDSTFVRHFSYSFLFSGNYKSQVLNLTLDEVKPEFFIPGSNE